MEMELELESTLEGLNETDVALGMVLEEVSHPARAAFSLADEGRDEGFDTVDTSRVWGIELELLFEFRSSSRPTLNPLLPILALPRNENWLDTCLER